MGRIVPVFGNPPSETKIALNLAGRAGSRNINRAALVRDTSPLPYAARSKPSNSALTNC